MGKIHRRADRARFDFDPNDLRTLAVEDGKGYLLTGEKTFVPYAAEADAILVYARKTGQTASLDGLTQGFIIPKGTPGLEIGERQKTLGVHALPLYSIRLNEVHLNREDRLGGHEGHEFGPLLSSMQLALASLAVGMSRAALDYAINLPGSRCIWGSEGGQSDRLYAGEMATEIGPSACLPGASWMLVRSPDAAKGSYLALTAMVGDDGSTALCRCWDMVTIVISR
jgi:alkylation response protein AidB-like acyl-CoA dehydrogenase